MNGWKTLTSQTAYSAGKWLKVEDRTVVTPGGETIEHWAWVTSPNYINVFPVMEDGRALLFRQGKYGLEGDSLAPVGGYIEEGEEPLAAAVRELREETGCEAREWVDLGRYIVDPNRGIAWGSLYLALGARKVTERSAFDLEEQEPVLLTVEEVEAALLAGRFRVLAWASCAAFALMRMKTRAQTGRAE